jgi:hypothetical protein
MEPDSKSASKTMTSEAAAELATVMKKVVARARAAELKQGFRVMELDPLECAARGGDH